LHDKLLIIIFSCFDQIFRSTIFLFFKSVVIIWFLFGDFIFIFFFFIVLLTVEGSEVWNLNNVLLHLFRRVLLHFFPKSSNNFYGNIYMLWDILLSKFLIKLTKQSFLEYKFTQITLDLNNRSDRLKHVKIFAFIYNILKKWLNP